MENILHDINREHITMSPSDIKRNTLILESVKNYFVDKMKQKDPLFNCLFKRVFYGGSYYDGLKVGNPDEFDLDFLLVIPQKSPYKLKGQLTTSNVPGFVHFKLTELDEFQKMVKTYPTFGKFFDSNHYLCTPQVLTWMESLVQKTINDLPTRRCIPTATPYLTIGNESFEITFRKDGPAMKLHIEGSGVEIDIDFVACFLFDSKDWPKNGFKTNPVPSKSEFFIVPKKPKGRENVSVARYWRLSFQEQERVLIVEKDKLKQSVRLIKSLRENLGHKCIASYYIKTIALHLVEKKDKHFWNGTLANVYMTLLREFQQMVEKQNIPYYWYQKNNLVSGISAVQLANVSNRLKSVIKTIEKDPTAVRSFYRKRTDNTKPKETETDDTNANSSCVLS